MRPPTREYHSRLRFNITPLIDIVFLLITFFLLSIHLVQPVEGPQHDEQTELSQSSEYEQEEPLALPLVITIYRSERIEVRGKEVDFGEIDQLVIGGKQEQGDRFQVHLRADKNVPFKLIEPVMWSCARSQVVFKYRLLPATLETGGGR